jgi:CheY-like chemotaxis protein
MSGGTDPGRAPIRLLVVDDDGHVRRAMRRFLSQLADVLVEDFASALDALARVSDASLPRFDGALLDVDMPVVDGPELATRLATIAPYLRIAFVTAAARDLSSFGHVVIRKPWVLREMEDFIASCRKGG